MSRLDSEIWTASPLGLIGLPGAVTAAGLAGGTSTYYMPFYDWMRAPAAIPAELRQRCELVVGKREIQRVISKRVDHRSATVLDLALVAPVDVRGCVLRGAERQLEAAAVVAGRLDTSHVAMALCYWVSPAISRSTAWADVFGKLSMLGVLAEHLVSAGYVGVVAPVPDARVRRSLAPVLSGARTLKQVVEAMGARP